MPVSIFRLHILFSHNKCCLFVARHRGMYHRLSELDTAIADAFRDTAQQIRDNEHTRCEKMVRVCEKWKSGFNS